MATVLSAVSYISHQSSRECKLVKEKKKKDQGCGLGSEQLTLVLERKLTVINKLPSVQLHNTWIKKTNYQAY